MESYHKSFFDPNIAVLKCSGLWAFLNNDDKTKYRHFMWTLFCLSICQCYWHSMGYYRIKDTIAHLDSMIEHFGMLLTHLLGSLKMLIIFIHRKKVVKVMQALQSNEFNYDSTDTFKPYDMATKYKAVSRRATMIFFLLASGVPISKSIPAIFHLFKMKEGLSPSGNVTCDDVLPYFNVTPFPDSTNALCLAGIIFQNVPMIIFAWQICGSDTLFVSCLMCLKSHIMILKEAFQSIRQRCLVTLNLPKDYEILYDSQNRALDDMMIAEMRKSTIHFQTIIRLAEEIEGIFTIIVLMQVTMIIFLMVSCLYMMSTVDVFSGTFNAELEYLSALTTQVTLYCWFGNEITLASSDISLKIYTGDWLGASPSFKKGMLINMIRMKTCIYMTIGKFSPLTLATLVGILRGSYSYLAVLRNSRE